jgi:putative SOS response-associated peptidase YedK
LLHNEISRCNHNSFVACVFLLNKKKTQELENRFKEKFTEIDTYKTGFYNGFEHPNTPVITNQNQECIQLFQWGLIPGWAKNTDIQKYTLNAKVETMNEKVAFKDSTNNRCLILLDHFLNGSGLILKGDVQDRTK